MEAIGASISSIQDTIPLLPTAYCLLPTAYCLLPTAYCLLPCLIPHRSPPAGPAYGLRRPMKRLALWRETG
ncbi:hypothetical protein FJ424_14560 [Mesorhizobium sp. B3-1-8]|nr:hypothetical protein FJ424_14560 [Mesorhizobium sp. B3-1-8]